MRRRANAFRRAVRRAIADYVQSQIAPVVRERVDLARLGDGAL
jgi:hypothetical protein